VHKKKVQNEICGIFWGHRVRGVLWLSRKLVFGCFSKWTSS